jgi:hypothetical protein
MEKIRDLEESKDDLREQIEDDLRGDCSCDFITKEEMVETLDDFENWLETAKLGDIYYYDDNAYELA